MLLQLKRFLWHVRENIKAVIQILFIYFRYLNFKKQHKKIIIFSACNGFGDYLWSRHIAYSIRHSEKYKDFKIIAITVKRWTDFVQHCDANLYDCLIAIEVPAFAPKILLKFLQFLKCDLLIQMEPWIQSKYFAIAPIYHYCHFKTDPSRFGGTQSVESAAGVLGIVPQYAPLPLIEIVCVGGGIPSQPFVILTLSGYTEGTFSKEQLLKIIEIITQKTNYSILFFGDEKDIPLLKRIDLEVSKNIQSRLINGINQFPTYHLAWIINKSQFVICPNTAIYHFCLFLNKSCVCVCTHSGNSMDFSKTNNEYVCNNYTDNKKHTIAEIETARIEKAVLKMIERFS